MVHVWTCALACRRRRPPILSTLKFKANEDYVTVQPANGQQDTIRNLTVSVHVYMHRQFCKTELIMPTVCDYHTVSLLVS